MVHIPRGVRFRFAVDAQWVGSSWGPGALPPLLASCWSSLEDTVIPHNQLSSSSFTSTLPGRWRNTQKPHICYIWVRNSSDEPTDNKEWVNFYIFSWTNTQQLRAERVKVRAVRVGMLTDSWGWGEKITIIPLSIKTKTWGNEEKKKTGKYMSSPWETEWKTDEIISSERQPRNLWEASKFIGLSLLIISLSTAFHVKYNLYTQYKLTPLNTLTKTFWAAIFLPTLP